ncbi:hypothetical protein [Roseospira navarrensis]|uniref:Cytochrome c domain-containing protein n=1 Tax=Roseospira navarrensis TaxID=140058 RepID=A0A7X2D4Z1_9PROT|nr:hypothetical protein [Roseospira navarrensis]MQX37132.1 hypothetical protein [Roseospira navarrensis]
MRRILRSGFGAAVVLWAAAVSVLSGPASAEEMAAADAAARRIIAAHCALCHPPLPDGTGWVQMTVVPRDRAGWASELRRMGTDYDAPLSMDERMTLLDYLSRAFGPGADG